MKKLLKVLLVCVLSISLFGCSRQYDDWGIYYSTKDVVTSIGVTIVIDVKETEGITSLTTDESFVLEKKYNDGSFKEVPPIVNAKFPTTNNIIELKPGEEKEMKIVWSDWLGSVTVGTYRIVKNVECVNENGEKMNKKIYAQFKVVDVCRKCLK